MKTYRETLDALRFTPQQKAAIAEDLLAAAQAGQVRAPRRKWGRVAAAAILAAALCAACASGALQEALSVLASQFGSDPKQQEVIGDLTRPSAASATDNGVTISVDAVMGDGNSLVVLYRMERADGQPVLPQTEETKNVSDGNNTLRFEMVDYPASIDSLSYPSGFLDFEVTDSTLYFYQRFTASQDFDPSQPVEITLKNLYSHEYYSTGISYNLKEAPVVDRIIPLVDGSWTLTVSLDSVDASLDLGSGQTFHAESNRYPLSGTILSLRLSSLSLVLDYAFTIDEDTRAALAAEHASNPELVANLPLEPWMFVTLTDFSPDEVPYLTLTDGSTLTLNDLGYATHAPDRGTGPVPSPVHFQRSPPPGHRGQHHHRGPDHPPPRRLSPETHTRPKAAFGLGARRLTGPLGSAGGQSPGSPGPPGPGTTRRRWSETPPTDSRGR